MRKFAVISDSSADLDDNLRDKYPVTLVPFTISFPSREFVDNENADTKELMEFMKETSEVITSSCPSPGDYLEALEKNKDADSIFIQTISGRLSGSFNSAMVAKDMFLENNPEKNVHVIDSSVAGAGSTALFLKLYEFINDGLEFSEIVEKIEKVRPKVRTLFNSEDFSQLVKNGRMLKITGTVAHAINLQPIMRDNSEGEITTEKITRGLKGMAKGMIDAIAKYTSDQSDKILVISHNFAEDKVNLLLEKVRENFNFKEIHVVPTSMICTSYVSYRGIIVGFIRD